MSTQDKQIPEDEGIQEMKKRFKDEDKKQREEMKRKARLAEMEAKKQKLPKAEIKKVVSEVKGEMKMAAVARHIQNAVTLSANSKQQVLDQFEAFDTMVISQIGDMHKLIETMPAGVELPESFKTEMARLTDDVEVLKRKRSGLYSRTQAVNTDEPLMANAELLDIGAELSSLQLELASSVMPAVLSLHQIATAEIKARKEQ